MLAQVPREPVVLRNNMSLDSNEIERLTRGWKTPGAIEFLLCVLRLLHPRFETFVPIGWRPGDLMQLTDELPLRCLGCGLLPTNHYMCNLCGTTMRNLKNLDPKIAEKNPKLAAKIIQAKIRPPTRISNSLRIYTSVILRIHQQTSGVLGKLI